MAEAVEAPLDPDAQRPRPTGDDLVVDIVDALAAAKDVDPTAEDLQLAGQIDLDAIVGLYTGHHPDDLTVEFTVDGHAVTVRGDGQVTVA